MSGQRVTLLHGCYMYQNCNIATLLVNLRLHFRYISFVVFVVVRVPLIFVSVTFLSVVVLYPTSQKFTLMQRRCEHRSLCGRRLRVADVSVSYSLNCCCQEVWQGFTSGYFLFSVFSASGMTRRRLPSFVSFLTFMNLAWSADILPLASRRFTLRLYRLRSHP